MIDELKHIRKELLVAIESEDLVYAKMMVNRLDSLIYGFSSKTPTLTELKPGTKVLYAPTRGTVEKGIVKSTAGMDGVFVVFKCAEHWENYANYTGIWTPVCHLKLGWPSEL